MDRRLKQKIAAVAAVAVVLAGGTLAAVTAVGQGPLRAGRSVHHRVRGQDLSTAAGYLGVSAAQLAAELRSGRTLAQVASASSGKSTAGLVGALVAAKRAKLAAAAANLTRRVTAEVNRGGGPGPSKPRARALHGLVGSVAASYLGVSVAQLRAELRSGKTLAQIADSSSGRSAAGLIDALVAAKRHRLTVAVAAGKLTQARENALAAKLNKRVTRLVNRKLPKKRASG